MTRIIAFDVETPNCRNDRICSIGLAVIENGKITWSHNYLVNPECPFDERNIQVHGISPSMVTDAPTFPSVWEEIGGLFRENLVIAHNATFDLCVLKKTLNAYGISFPLIYYACTMQIARATVHGVQNVKLATLCEHYGIDLDHHNSGSDSRACAEIFCNLVASGLVVEEFTESYSLDFSPSTTSRTQQKHMSENTRGLLTLSGILSGITCDDLLVPSEIEYLRCWMDDNASLRGNYPYDKIYSTIEAALEDGVLEHDELDFMLRLFKQVSDPVNACGCGGFSLEFTGKTFCLSGDFEYGDKSSVEALLKERGGIPQKNVTRKTDYLIVGGKGSAAWCAGNYGTKVKKALELQEKGLAIQILREHDIL